MTSKIFTGVIEHHRYKPVTHDLSYPVYMFALDLDDLPRLNTFFPLFGYNRFAVHAIHDRDYLDAGSLSIKNKVIQLLKKNQVAPPIEKVVMVTSARYFNYIFNPVSFHYCYDTRQTLAAIVAEVNNTYGERHPYVLVPDRTRINSWPLTFQTPKVFHVSPFNQVEGDYAFFFSALENHLDIKIELHKGGTRMMTAQVKADSVVLTRTSLLKTMLKHPFSPHLNIPRIYSHAFRLFFQKKLTFYDKPVPVSHITMKKTTPGLVESICKKIVVTAMKQIKTGSLKLKLPDQTPHVFGTPGNDEPVVMTINDYGFFKRVVMDGEIGFGEAYMHGEWDSPDLVGLLKVIIINRDHLSDGSLIFSFLKRVKEKVDHDKRKNSIENTPDNIRAHYDLSNAFYSLFLDEKMLYSCAIFKNPTDSLETAQAHKMDRMLDQADVHKEHHILEIGCGWGGFAVYAARKTGCRVTGITVSKAQYQQAIQRIRDEGLEDRITIKLEDYRHTTGKFDRIVSIEMIEAVGPQYFATYFKTGQALLKRGGKMVFQAITIDDDRYERYCKERDWIQKHIFPGGHMPCMKVLKQTIADSSDFSIEDIYHMGGDYAKTLAQWQKRFLDQKKEVLKLGFDETFVRKWRYYLSICEAGFTVGSIDDIQMTLTR